MAPTTLTRLHPFIWQITLSSPPDNRLTPELFSSLSEHLDLVEKEWRLQSGQRDVQGPMSDPKTFGEYGGAGAVIITGIDRFFSNGLDYKSATANKRFFEDVYDPVMYRLLTFPLVTIGAINGHAFAGGMVLALACDYRIMTSGKGLMSMNEAAFGSSLPNSFSSILRGRIPHPPHLRDTLMAKRWNQKELKEAGLIDDIVDHDQLIPKAIEKGKELGPKVGAGAWGLIKDGIWHDIIDASRSGRPVMMPFQEAKVFWERVGRDKAKL